MSAFSDYLENKLIDHIFRATSYTMPAALYVSLHTATPLDSNTATEVSGNAYARAALAPSTSNWANTQNSGTAASSGTGGQTMNKAIVTFPTPTGSWGTVTHFGIYDASSAGNLLFYGALTVSKTISTSDVVTFPVDSLTVTLA
jgi:hypothetical protein